jgi:hypothetical protein
MDILEKLFGTTAKVKIMRLFLFNPEYVFTVDEIIDRGKMSSKEVKAELPNLLKVGLIKKKPFTRDVQIVKKKKITIKRVKGNGYMLDAKFPYLNALKTLLISVSLHPAVLIRYLLASAAKSHPSINSKDSSVIGVIGNGNAARFLLLGSSLHSSFKKE